MSVPVICTTLLIEKSPQALPLGAASIASAVKNHPEIKNFVDVQLKAFCLEDDFFSQNKDDDAASQYIADELFALASEKNKYCSSYIFCFSVFVWNVCILEKA